MFLVVSCLFLVVCAQLTRGNTEFFSLRSFLEEQFVFSGVSAGFSLLLKFDAPVGAEPADLNTLKLFNLFTKVV